MKTKGGGNLNPRRVPEKVVIPAGRARWAQRGAQILAGVYAAFWLWFGVGEMTTGNLSGAAHLFPVAVVVLLMLVANKRPDAAGVFLTVFGAVASVYFLLAVHGGWAFKVQAVTVAAAPLLVAGLLFLLSAASVRSAPASDSSKTKRVENTAGPKRKKSRAERRRQ